MIYTLTLDEHLCARVVAHSRSTHYEGTHEPRPARSLEASSFLTVGVTDPQEARAILDTLDVLGCIGEVAASRILNVAWTGCGKKGPDTRDVGGLIEIRAVSDQYRGLLLRPRDIEQTPYLLMRVDVDGRTGTALGWSVKAEVVASGRLLGGGTDTPCWILPVSRLRPLDTLHRWIQDVRGRATAGDA